MQKLKARSHKPVSIKGKKSATIKTTQRDANQIHQHDTLYFLSDFFEDLIIDQDVS